MTTLPFRTLAWLALTSLSAPFLPAQTSAASTPAASPSPAPVTKKAAAFSWFPSPEEQARIQKLSDADHAEMMAQLGITALRSGPSGSTAPGTVNPANYDEAKANPYPDYPDILTLKNGQKVTTPEGWWQQRRPEIVEDFEREVIGRVPANVPKVTWNVTELVNTTVAGRPVVAKQLIGHVDNSAHPAITVDIKMSLVTPANAKGPVPVLMMFGSGNLPGLDPSWPTWAGPEPRDPPSAEQLIAAGWGYVSISPGSIQADNGGGLTQGIIGLTNKGAHRKPDDWGALRAWAWGAARGLDYLETDAAVDNKHVGVEGVSRFGKAALVTMAFESRFALVLVGSSGEGGAKPHRRNFGEAVESLTGSGEYHWMAGNFLKYGAAQSSFGTKNANDLPVDSNELIALCAPRPTFISYGIPEKGDAKWLDQQGSYMATVAAGAVYRLLGVRDLGVTEDYHTAKMPPHDTGLLSGTLAWRQHDGGHEDRSNMRYFIEWANGQIGHISTAITAVPADQPMERRDPNSRLGHQQLVAKARQGGIDLYFLGDSITRRWGATDYPEFLANWKQNFFGWNAGDFGWGGDTTQNILWRIQHGELDGVNPKVIVLLAGTNNVGRVVGSADKVEDIARGIKRLIDVCREKAPDAKIILTAIFPRNDNPAVVPEINHINDQIAKFADGKTIRFLNINDQLANKDGVLFEGLTMDKLHPTAKGYQIWADGLRPILTELLGAPATTDHAPPPTGDPSAKAPKPL